MSKCSNEIAMQKNANRKDIWTKEICIQFERVVADCGFSSILKHFEAFLVSSHIKYIGGYINMNEVDILDPFANGL